MIDSSSIKKKIPKNSLLSALMAPTRKMANTELSNVFCGILVRLLKCFDQWFPFSF